LAGRTCGSRVTDGVFGKPANGVLKGAATKAAEKGQPGGNWRRFSARSGRRMATLYTKSLNLTRLAARAIGKLDRGETENRTSIPAPSAEVRAGNGKSQ